MRAGTAQFDALQLTGIGRVPMRGKSRFSGTPKTCEILRKGDKWYASVTFNVTPEAVARTAGSGTMAFDWGVKTLLTIARDDGGIETVDNPRWLKRRLEAIKALQRVVSEEAVAKRRCGLDPNAPLAKSQCFTVTPKLKRLYRQVAALHGKIARQRKDFYRGSARKHKTSHLRSFHYPKFCTKNRTFGEPMVVAQIFAPWRRKNQGRSLGPD